MVATTLVVNPVEEGKKLLALLVAKGIRLAAAACVKPAESDEWKVYLVEEADHIKGSASDIYAVIRSMDDSWLTEFDVRIQGPNNDVGKAILAKRQPYPPTKPLYLRHTALGHVQVDEAYIYPNSVPTK